MFALLTSLFARIRASTWPPLLGKAAVGLCAIVFFTWTGKTVGARMTERGPPPGTLAAVDGGVVEVAPASTADAGSLPKSEPPGPPAASTTSSRRRATADDPVYVNEADADELRRLPGVGPKRAEAILGQRRRIGRFSRPEDLLRVKGIGRRTLKKWRSLLRFEARASSASPDGGSGV